MPRHEQSRSCGRERRGDAAARPGCCAAPELQRRSRPRRALTWELSHPAATPETSLVLASESASAKSPQLIHALFVLPGLGTDGVRLNSAAGQAPFGACRAWEPVLVPLRHGSGRGLPAARRLHSGDENPQIRRRALCRRRERSRSGRSPAASRRCGTEKRTPSSKNSARLRSVPAVSWAFNSGSLPVEAFGAVFCDGFAHHSPGKPAPLPRGWLLRAGQERLLPAPLPALGGPCSARAWQDPPARQDPPAHRRAGAGQLWPTRAPAAEGSQLPAWGSPVQSPRPALETA